MVSHKGVLVRVRGTDAKQRAHTHGMSMITLERTSTGSLASKPLVAQATLILPRRMVQQS